MGNEHISGGAQNLSSVSKTRPEESSSWKEIVEAQDQSNLSVAQYCKQYNISYSKLLYYRQKFRSVEKSKQDKVFPFVQVGVKSSCASRLKFQSGVILELEGIPEAAWLREVAK